MIKVTILALAALAQPALASTPETEALARALLVCAGKFGGLAFIGQSGVEDDIARFYKAATSLAGADFVKREVRAANQKAAEWVFANGGANAKLEEARRACLPLLEEAGK